MSEITAVIMCSACAKLIQDAVVSDTEEVIARPSSPEPVIDEELRDLIKDIDIAAAELMDAEETFKCSKRVLRNLNKKLKNHQKK